MSLEYVDIQRERPVSPTGIIIDASFLIQTLKPGTAKNAVEYIHDVIIPSLRALLFIHKRVDLVFDIYLQKKSEGWATQSTRRDVERK